MERDNGFSKVPAVTLTFWIIKILATTLGETGGDLFSMSLNWGYAAASAMFLVVFALAVTAQMRARRFHPFLYWAVIVATTTLGTTMADFADRSLGIGYAGGSSLLFALLMLCFLMWRLATGGIAVDTVRGSRTEWFYWLTILLSQTLGTAVGDWTADSNGLGYGGGALVFIAGLAIVAALCLLSRVPRGLLFWIAFVLTRPLGATLGDLFDKPVAQGGFDLSRLFASVVLLVAIAVVVATTPQRAGGHPSAPAGRG